jgi:hypothetical protein
MDDDASAVGIFAAYPANYRAWVKMLDAILPGPQSDAPEAAEAARSLDYNGLISQAMAARGIQP